MSGTPYHKTAIFAAWALTSYAVAMAVWGAPHQLPGREIIWWMFPVLYAICTVAALGLADLLDDFQRQLGLREKFAFFLAHAFLFLAPMPVLRGFWLVWGLGLLMMPLLLFLQREINFNRLALTCGLLWLSRLARHHDDPPWWTLGFAALLLLMLIASHYFTAYRRYWVERGEAPLYFWRMAGLWIAGIMVTGGLAWFILPKLTPVEFITPPPPAAGQALEPRSQSPINLTFIFEVFFWSALIFGILYAIYWIRSKIRGGNKIPFQIARSTLQRVKEEIDRKVVQRWRANLMNPTDRVIFYYNMFCEAMGRFGLSRRPAMTPCEYRGFLMERSGIGRDRQDDLDFITELFQKALYGGDDIPSVDSRHFHRLAQEILNSHEKSHDPVSMNDAGVPPETKSS